MALKSSLSRDSKHFSFSLSPSLSISLSHSHKHHEITSHVTDFSHTSSSYTRRVCDKRKCSANAVGYNIDWRVSESRPCVISNVKAFGKANTRDLKSAEDHRLSLWLLCRPLGLVAFIVITMIILSIRIICFRILPTPQNVFFCSVQVEQRFEISRTTILPRMWSNQESVSTWSIDTAEATNAQNTNNNSK